MDMNALSPDITRERLLARLKAAHPRLLAVIAPAGYGKSTLVRQYASSQPRYTVCDCMRVGKLGDFARAVAGALANGDEAVSAAVGLQRLAGADEEAWSSFALDLWSTATSHPLFIFENTEHIADSAECVEFLSRLLTRVPQSRRIFICSRRGLPLSLSRYVAPHELITLHSRDLRFDDDEINVALQDTPMHAHDVERVKTLTHGWPMAVLLLARLARERSISEVFDRLGGIAFDNLYDYLADQVLATMPEERLLRLLAVAAIPRATASEVAAALNDPPALTDLRVFAMTSPFLYAISNDTYEAHPLVQAMIRERHAEKCALTLRAAADALRLAEPLRSAELYMDAGDEEAAASQLENAAKLFVTDLPPLFAEITSRLSSGVLLRHLSVWSAATAVRATAIPHRQWLHEALIARDNLAPDAPIALKIGVLSSLGNVLTNLGRHEEAIEVFRSFDIADVPEAHLVAQMSIACVEARRGNCAMGMQMWTAIETAFMGVKFTRAICIEEISTRNARYNGDRTAERMYLETAIALAHESRTALAVALTLEEAAFAAWFAGEDALFERYASELASAIAPNTARGTEVFRGCISGDYSALVRNEGIEHPKITCYAALIGCGCAPKRSRFRLAQRALAAGTHAGEPMLEAIGAIACAETAGEDRGRYVERARLAASRVDAKASRDAVESYAAGKDHAMLDPLLRRLRGDSAAHAVKRSKLSISILHGRVERNGAAVKLSNRELELVLYLASENRAFAREEILEALWPNRPDEQGTILRVNVARVREKTGENILVTTDKGYRIDPSVAVDLVEIETSVQRARRASSLDSPLREELQEHFSQLCCARPPTVLRWEWFSRTQLRIDEVLREAALLLGRDALRNGGIEEAMQLARQMIERDHYDEPARELAIRAHLAGGDYAAALRELRVYRTILATELGAEPSQAINDLFSDLGIST